MPAANHPPTEAASGTNANRVDRPGGPAGTFDLGPVTVVIPALNEAESLPRVLADLPPVGQVIVVDNGSTDGTGEVATRLGATVVRERRRGYGAACLRGLAEIERQAAAGRPRPQVAVFLDADYSDYPERLPELVRPILAGEADLVIGSRTLGRRQPGAMPPQSLFGNWLACLLMRLLWRVRYTDLGPFRAIRYDALRWLGMADRDFGWTIEMQIKAAQRGLRVREVPVPYRRRVGRSKISGTVWGSVRAGAKILYTIAKYWLGGHRRRAN